MVSDIVQGAVLPPIVIGVVVDQDDLRESLLQGPSDNFKLLSEKYKDLLSIIDGMQRTTALFEAVGISEQIKREAVRVEFWIADSTEALIYRMLVLNSGQVPWTLSRQLQVVYSPLIKEISDNVDFDKVLNVNKGERRVKAGQYGPDNLAELYIAFGLRKTDIDTQEALADEFSRLDMTEALSSHKYRDFFYPTMQMMVNLDRAFSRYDAQIEPNARDTRTGENKDVLKGRSIFDRKPARIGFVVSVATAVLGRIGMQKDEDQQAAKDRLIKLQENSARLVDRMGALTIPEMMDFLKLDMLSEQLGGQKRAAVGRQERAFFDNAFKILIDVGFDVPTMEPCWRG